MSCSTIHLSECRLYLLAETAWVATVYRLWKGGFEKKKWRMENGKERREKSMTPRVAIRMAKQNHRREEGGGKHGRLKRPRWLLLWSLCGSL